MAAEPAPTALTPPVDNELKSVANDAAPSHPDSFTFPTSLPTPPFINVDGVPNFRDCGGYLLPTSSDPDSKRYMIRKELLYRCAHPQLITPTGKTTLAQNLGIKHVYDLRSAPEVRKLTASLSKSDPKPDPDTIDPHSPELQVPGTQRHFTPVYEEEDYSPAALARKLSWYTAAQTDPSSTTTTHLPATSHSTNTPAQAQLPANFHPSYPYSAGFVLAYRDIATHACLGRNAAYPQIFRQILNNPSQPILFHCTAGKDRTGVLAALLLRLAGLDLDTICYDYALTEPGLGAWREVFIQRISRTGLGGAGSNEAKKEGGAATIISREEAARIVGSRSGNMRAFIEGVLEGEWGGVERYLKEMAGLSEDEIEKLRAVLRQEVSAEQDVVVPKGIVGWTAEGGVQD